MKIFDSITQLNKMFRLQFAQPYVNGTHTSNDNSISDD